MHLVYFQLCQYSLLFCPKVLLKCFTKVGIFLRDSVKEGNELKECLAILGTGEQVGGK